MTNKINKICPLLYLGWLSFAGQTEQKDSTEIECLQSQCSWFDEDQGQCAIIILTRAIEKKDKS